MISMFQISSPAILSFYAKLRHSFAFKSHRIDQQIIKTIKVPLTSNHAMVESSYRTTHSSLHEFVHNICSAIENNYMKNGVSRVHLLISWLSFSMDKQSMERKWRLVVQLVASISKKMTLSIKFKQLTFSLCWLRNESVVFLLIIWLFFVHFCCFS